MSVIITGSELSPCGYADKCDRYCVMKPDCKSEGAFKPHLTMSFKSFTHDLDDTQYRWYLISCKDFKQKGGE